MQKNPRKTAVRDYLVAFLVFGLFSGTLLWAVRIKPYEKQNGGRGRASKIYSISCEPDECQPNHRQLVKWLPILDPSRIAMARTNGPYRSGDWISDRQPLGLRPQPLPPKAIRFESTAAYVFPFREPKVAYSRPLNPGGLIAESEWPISPEPKRVPLGVYWYGADMSPLDKPPTLPIDTLPAHTGAGKLVCVMDVNLPGRREGMPRVTLRQRSGDAQFDKAVIKQLFRWLRKQSFEDPAYVPPSGLTVIWYFDAAKIKDSPPAPPPAAPPKPPEVAPKPKPEEG